jgi:DNA repair ATPase RecN
MASSNWPYHITSEMQKMECELKASQTEVERLNKQLNHIVENPHEYDVKSVFEPHFVEELQSEIKMLTKKLSITEDELADAREWLDERYKATSEADERAEKAEAEVEFWKSKAYEAEQSEGKRELEVENLKELVKWYEARHSTIISK